VTVQHTQLAAGRWNSLSFLEQMANIGSEVERAINWRAKKKEEYAIKAFERALELMDLTLVSVSKPTRLKEVARARDEVAAFFTENRSSFLDGASLKKYFFYFTLAARRNT